MFSPLKSSKSYECSICNYNTGNIKDYNKHLMTRKHENRTKLNHIEQKIPKNPKKPKKIQKSIKENQKIQKLSKMVKKSENLKKSQKITFFKKIIFLKKKMLSS